MLESVEKFFSKIMGGTNTEREIKRIWPIVHQINEYAQENEKLTDEELKSKTNEFKYRLRIGETVDDLLPEAFAVVKETCRRLVGKKWLVRGQEIVWDMVPYDVQLIGGVVLHEGKIAEMATGEGKTLVASMPLYLNALQGNGAHLITVNDYLAQRDCEWMGEIYKFLGLTVSAIFGDQSPEERRAAYHTDITYGTNNEFGFDYLRDNMASDVWSVVQRPLHYAIVDEVDSVLIDESRTPLIISGAVGAPKNIYTELKPTVENLYKRQKELVQQLFHDGKALLEQDEEQAGIKILQAQRGDPKNVALLELLTSEFWVKKLIERIQGQNEVNKTMGEIDAELYYTIDEKSHVIDITEKGRIFLSGGRDQDIANKIQKLDELDETLQKISSQKNRAEYFTHDPVSGLCDGLTLNGRIALAKVKSHILPEHIQAIDALAQQLAEIPGEVNQLIQNRKIDKASAWRNFYDLAKKLDRSVNALAPEGKKFLLAGSDGKYSEKQVDALEQLLTLIKNEADVDSGAIVSRQLTDRRRELENVYFEQDKQFGCPIGLREDGKIALLAVLYNGDPLLVPIITKLERLLKNEPDDTGLSVSADQKQDYFEFRDNGAILSHVTEKGRIALLGGNPDLYVLPDRSLVEERDMQIQKVLDDTLNQSAFDYTSRILVIEELEKDLRGIAEYIATGDGQEQAERTADFYKPEANSSVLNITPLGYHYLSHFAAQTLDVVAALDADLAKYKNDNKKLFAINPAGNITELSAEQVDRLLGFSYQQVEEGIHTWREQNQISGNENYIKIRRELDQYLSAKFGVQNSDGLSSISRRFEDVNRIASSIKRVFEKINDRDTSLVDKLRWIRRYFTWEGNINENLISTGNIMLTGLTEIGKKSLLGLVIDRAAITDKLVELLSDTNIEINTLFEMTADGYPLTLEKSARSVLLDGLPYFSFSREYQKFRDEIIQYSSRKVNTKAELDGLLPREKAQLRSRDIMLDDREMTDLLSNAHLPNFIMSNEEIEHWFRIQFERKPRYVMENKRDKLWQDYNRVEERVQNISQLLRAFTLYQKDVDYVVKSIEEGETRRTGAQKGNKAVMIVDQFTGRLMPGRRFSEGLHEALEAKEGVEVQAESQTLATITLQNFFRLYTKLAGMTGTAETEAQEFFSTYKLDVIVIPTNRQVIRDDQNDVIYRTKKEKYDALIDEAIRMHEAGRPVLIGTISVDVSQHLSNLFTLRGIPVANWLKKGDVSKELESGRFHTVLNAKYHKNEAEIVSKAGLAGAITIATNMAGRGTDIKLTREVIEHGGLHIIGSEKHEARRIDRQLRGRAGRQGDPGSSRFYLSLEDDLMRLFGSDRITSIMSRLGSMEEGERIEHPLITRSIERAQKKVEERNFEIRKSLLEYDNVLNEQRKIIYKRRQNLLGFAQPPDFVESKVKRFIDEPDDRSTWKIPELYENLKHFFGVEPEISVEEMEAKRADDIKKVLLEWVEEKLGEQRHLTQMQERHRILGYCRITDVLCELVRLKIHLHNAGSTDVSRWNMEGISYELERILGTPPDWLLEKPDFSDAPDAEKRILDWAVDIYHAKENKHAQQFNELLFAELSINKFLKIFINGAMNRYLPANAAPGTWNTEEFLNDLERVFMERPALGENEMRTIRREKIIEKIQLWLEELQIPEEDERLYRNRVFGYFSSGAFVNAIIEYLFMDAAEIANREKPALNNNQKAELQKYLNDTIDFSYEGNDWNVFLNQLSNYARQVYYIKVNNYLHAYDELMIASASIEEIIEAAIIVIFNQVNKTASGQEQAQKQLTRNLTNMFLGKPDKALPAATDEHTLNQYREDLIAWGLNYYKVYSDRVERFHQERLSTEIVFDSVLSMIEDSIYSMIGNILGNESSLDAGQLRRLESECRLVFRQSPRLRDDNDADMDPNAVMEKLNEWATGIYRKRINEIGPNVVARYERYYILDKIDENWRAHLNGVDELREGIGLRGYGQKDPLLEYKSEAYKMFMKMIDSINREVVSTLFRVFDVGGEFEDREMRRSEPVQMATSHSQVELFKQLMTTRKQQPALAQAPRDGGVGVRKPVVNAPKVGRNDPCPCGSGKKYKNCCGKSA